MAEFVWFFGASGTGKATIIEKIADGQFAIPDIGKEIVICKESLEFGREQRRLALEHELGKYALSQATVLIKGQGIDLSTLRIPYHLKESQPGLTQRIVFVYTKPEILPERTAHRDDKYWPNPSHDFAAESTFQINEVGKLCGVLDTTPIIVDNSGSEPFITREIKLADLK